MNILFQRYLRLLGFEHPPTGLEGLRQLVRAHIVRVPFENVSKLLLFDREGRGRLNTIDEFLNGIEQQDLGGTCYTSNPFFCELLHELGYEAELRSANMNTPNVHSSIRLALDGLEYHIDVGNAAPFLEPVPLDRLPYEFARGEMKWVFDRAEDNRLRCDVLQNGERIYSYTVNHAAQSHEFFQEIIIDSFQRGRTFMSLLRLVRIFPEHTVELMNRSLKVHRGQATTETTINSMDELRHVVDTLFLMPRCPVEKAVEILERINEMKFFGATQERSLYA